MIPRADVEALGDAAIRWKRDPSCDARALLAALRAWPNVIDAIVTEQHACVTFDPASPPRAPWEAIDRAASAASPPAREHALCVRYDGPDLDDVARACGISRDEVIARHTARVYVVRLVGFLPGFAYLGDVDPAIRAPRRSTPRPRVPPGSVGIAARYTGVYPCASAGGWSLIGTAVDFVAFDPARGATLALGDRVRFEAAR
jgi:UPF0271 protein